MAYAYRGSGYLADAVQGTGVAPYLFRSGGYSGSTTAEGAYDIGTRMIALGGTIESYSCAQAILTSLSVIPSSNLKFNSLIGDRVIADGGTVDGKTCFLAEYEALKLIQIA